MAGIMGEEVEEGDDDVRDEIETKEKIGPDGSTPS
jgi:hypothetical protein